MGRVPELHDGGNLQSCQFLLLPGLVWPWALTSLEQEGAPGNATLPCASHLGGRGGVGIVAPGVEGQFARPPIFLAAARSISGGQAPPDLGMG